MTNETGDGLKRIALAYHYTKDLWLGVVPNYRRAFMYSKPHTYRRGDVLAWRNRSDVRDFADSDRYSWVNWVAYNQHSTVEIRCHETTTCGLTVNNWVVAHTRFCDAMSELGVGKITRVFGNKKPAEIMREMRVIIREPSISRHLASRFNRFN
jgi:hypothetical protein